MSEQDSAQNCRGQFENEAPLISFTPVPVRPRHDGWTVERQIAFVEKLADTNSIAAACRHVGMSRESVRRLRRHPLGQAFRDAVDAALDCGYADIEEAAAERARNGVARPIFYKGEQVGEWRHHDERLTMFLLRFRRRHRFGAGVDHPNYPPPVVYGPDEQFPFDPDNDLGGWLEVGNFEDVADPEGDGDGAEPPADESK